MKTILKNILKLILKGLYKLIKQRFYAHELRYPNVIGTGGKNQNIKTYDKTI